MTPRLIVGFLVGALIIITACGGGSSDKIEPTVPAIGGVQAATPTEPASAANQSQLVDVFVGERLEVDDRSDLIVNSFRRSIDGQALSDDFYTLELEPGDEFLVLTITVINDTDLPAGLDTFDLTLLSRGVDIRADQGYSFGVRGGLDAEVLPVASQATGLVLWSARQGFDQLTLEYTPGGTGRSYLVGLDGDFATEPSAPDATAPSLSDDDEEEIQKLVAELAEIFSKEDWSRAYDLLPPSVREICSKGRYLAGVAVAIEIAKAFVGEEAWEALKDDAAADGYDIRSIEPVLGGAIVYYAEGSDDGVDMVKEDGEWWVGDDTEDDPCDFSFD